MTPWNAVHWLACWLAVSLEAGPVFVKLILSALLEPKEPGFRPIKYALFPPLGLAALAGYLDDED